MVEKILARESPFKEILQQFHPAVPQLQRNYSWTTTEWNDLWDDLTGFFEDLDNSSRPYFIGTVVLETSGGDVAILDGQQRIATLTILIEVLTSKLRVHDMEAAAFHENSGLRERLSKDKYRPFIKLNQYDDPFFRALIIERKKDAKTKYGSHKLIRSAQAFFSKRIDELFDESPELDAVGWLDQFCGMILNKIFFVYVQSHPADSHQVFRVLNDRGRGLSQLDLFRTFLLQKADEQSRDEIASSWSQVLDIQAPGNPQDLLRFYWITRRGDVKSRRLFRDIEDQVKRKAITAEDLADELFFYSEIYKDLVSPDIAMGPERAHLLQTAVDLKAKALYPLLMKVMFAGEEGKVAKKEFDQILDLSVTLYMRHTIIGQLDNFRLESLMFALAKSFPTELDVAGVALAIKKFAADRDLTDNNFVDQFSKASAPTDAIAKAILRSIESYAYNKSEVAIPVTSALHLEHIYPKKPKPEQRFVDHDDWLSRYGNLTLLDGKINQKASNADFASKKAKYKGSNITMTNSLCDLGRWDKAAIEQRQLALAGIAAKVWSFENA